MNPQFLLSKMVTLKYLLPLNEALKVASARSWMFKPRSREATPNVGKNLILANIKHSVLALMYI